MNIEAMEALLGVVRTGNFTEAARRLNTSQPTLSRRISGFEDLLGVSLIERARGRAVPTEAGRALLPHAEAAIANVHDGLAAVRALKKGDAGALILAFAPTMCEPALIDALLGFRNRFRDVELSLRVCHSSAVSDLVRRGEAAIGLRWRHDPDEKLISTEIKIEEMAVICAPDHPLASYPAVALEDMSNETWIATPASLSEPGEGVPTVLSRYGLRAKNVMPMSDLVAQKMLIAAGFGIGILPRRSALLEIEAGDLRVLNTPSLTTEVPVVMVVRKGGYCSEPARLLSIIIKEALSNLNDRVPPAARA